MDHVNSSFLLYVTFVYITFMLSHLDYLFLLYHFYNFLPPSSLSCSSSIYLFFNPFSFVFITSLLSLFLLLILYFISYFLCLVRSLAVHSLFFTTLIPFYIMYIFPYISLIMAFCQVRSGINSGQPVVILMNNFPIASPVGRTEDCNSEKAGHV